MNAGTHTNRTTSEQREIASAGGEQNGTGRYTPQRKDPAGGRGRWKESIADTVTSLPCRLQVERGARCPSCEYLRIVRSAKYIKGVCTFLGETLFREGRHE